jgi:DNA polymerase-3 subunit beta
MKFTATRAMPILANVLLVAKDDQVSVTATDLEVELVASTEAEIGGVGEITVAGRKLLDICRALPEQAEAAIQLSGEKLSIKSGRSKFTLTTLPAPDFPTIEDINAGQTLTLPQATLGTLLDKTHFSRWPPAGTLPGKT